MKTPIIGIILGGQRDDPEEGIKGYTSYAEAVTEAGGEPLFLEPKPDPSSDLRAIHGLLLTGGIDIHPGNYDSRNEPGDEALPLDALIEEYRMKCSPERDAYELPLTWAAFEARIPILGICRGFQVLNVVLGGSLIKDIRTGRKHWAVRKEEADEGDPGESRKHMITIISRSKLAEILDDCPILVNSRHHQGVMEKHIAPKLQASAFAPDNIIEAVESPDHPWALAVQWHPERKKDEYVSEPCKALFVAFVSAARENG
jgi:putative glutamine amidotransferase